MEKTDEHTCFTCKWCEYASGIVATCNNPKLFDGDDGEVFAAAKCDYWEDAMLRAHQLEEESQSLREALKENLTVMRGTETDLREIINDLDEMRYKLFAIAMKLRERGKGKE